MQPSWNLSLEDLPAIQPHIGFVDSAGRHVTTDEVARGRGRFVWTVEVEAGAPSAAVAELRAGMRAGSLGDLKRATEHFREAHRMAPRWAQPVYQGAWTSLLLGDAVLAESLYAWTDRMVPSGYWTTKVAVNCLRRERTGEFPRGSYLRYVLLEGMSDLDDRRKALEAIVESSPAFAPAWKDLAVLRGEAEPRAEAVERGLASHPDLETRAFLLIHKAQLLEHRGMSEDAATLLTSLLDPAIGTLQTTALARLKLAALAARGY